MTTKTGAAPIAPPEPKTLTLTPSGIEIAYFVEDKKAGVKRGYSLRRVGADEAEGIDHLDPFVEVPSVTTVLGCLDKPALPWWGMKIGAIGILELWNTGHVVQGEDGSLLVNVNATWQYATEETLLEALKFNKLTVNHVLSSAGTRGQSAHDAFEAWAGLRLLPNPDDYPPEEHGYIVGLRAFCEDMGDAWETGGQEIAVGSVEHGFAGRYDLRGRVTKSVRLMAKALTQKGEPLVKGPKFTTIPAGTKGLVDLKTSKGIYPTHLMQLEAYEGGGVECGYEPTDWRAVLHVTASGHYEFKQAKATYDDFLAVLRTYKALEGVKEALK